MKKYLPLLLRIIVVIILIQTLRFMFTACPDSINIFSKVGMKPVGRIGIGQMELIAGILLLIPTFNYGYNRMQIYYQFTPAEVCNEIHLF